MHPRLKDFWDDPVGIPIHINFCLCSDLADCVLNGNRSEIIKLQARAYQYGVCLLGNYFKVASILAAFLRYTRLRHPNHPRLGNRLAYNQFTREVDQVFEEELL